MRTIPHIASLHIASLLTPLALAFASCAVDGPAPTPGPDPGRDTAGDRKIVFTLASSSHEGGSTRGVTRAVEDPLPNEVAIDRLDVFMFDASGAQLFYPAPSQLDHDPDTQLVTITIPETTLTASLLDTDCTIFLVANTLLERAQMSGLTLDALSDLVTANGSGTMFNTSAAPANFLMTGSVAARVTASEQNLGTVTLRRAAAKIVVEIENAAVEGYVRGEARVRLSNYLDRTRLASETPVATADDYKTSAWRPMTEGVSEPLYSYHNDWRGDTDGSTETYITLEVEWTPEGTVDPEPTVYYYRIPFSYIDAGAEAEQHRDRLRRNHIYQFSVNLSELGGIDPEDAVDLAANFDVIEWTDRRVVVSILSYHYLFVYNSRMQIHEQPAFEWEYRSSIAIDEVEITGVECMQYFADGSSRTVEYNPGDPQYPRITYDQRDGKTYFTATSMVPVNYVPLEIALKVSNAAQLFTSVHLTIFPKKYVTASYSNGGTDQNTYPQAGAYTSPTSNQTNNDAWGTNTPGGSGGDNFNFYRITTISLDTDDQARGIMIGDPTEIITPHPAGTSFGTSYNQTRTDNNSWNVISPEFIIASRRGITNARTWAQARERCSRYREAQYPAGTWRVPTFAELALLGEMQNDDNSAIKSLFVNATGNGWWTARNAYRIRVDLYTYATGNGVNQGGTAAVRCVHDTWKD